MRRTAAFFTAALALAAPVALAQQQPAATEATTTQPPLPVLRVSAKLIQVPVLVLYPTHDKVVTAITPDRFSLSFDKGPLVKAANARMEGDDPIDLAIVLDARGAQNSFLPTIDQTIANLIPAQLHPQDHVSIYAMTCGSIRSVANLPASDPARLKAAVDSALSDWTARRTAKDKSPCSSNAPVMDLLAYAANGLSKAPGRRVILAFTNGDDKSSTHKLEFVATLSQALGVTIFALNADEGTTRFNQGSVGAGLGAGAGTVGNPFASSAAFDPHDMVVSALLASNRGEPVFRFPALCESSGGVELRIDLNNPAPTLARAVEMIRNRYVIDFPLVDERPIHHDLRVSIDRDSFFIRPAGNGIFIDNPAQVPAPNSIEPASAPAPQLAAVPAQPAALAPAPATVPQVAASSPVAAPAPAPTPALTFTAPAQASMVPTLKTTARLVYVDVVVHDKQGQPIHGLKAEDFALLESGKSQSFKGFEEHGVPTSPQIAHVSTPAALPKLPEGTFSNAAVAASPQANGPLNVLLLDKLNTPGISQKEMKVQVNEYLLHAPMGQRTAIFGLTDHLLLLQGFTTNAEAIHAAINNTHGLQGTSLLSAPVEMLFPRDGTSASITDDDADNSRGPTAAMSGSQQLLAANQVETRALITLHAMDDLARYLATLPGRKNVVWFSGSFPVDIMPVALGPDIALSAPVVAENPFMRVKSVQKNFEQTSALLSRAQVAMYPIDVKGLKSAQIFGADDNGCGAGGGIDCITGVGTRALIHDFDDHNYGEHSTMNELADGTGGKAFLNTNDFATAMAKALDDGSNYYTIAYTPSKADWDGSFRNIEIKLRAKGYNLSYRKGYFAQEVKEPSGSKPMQIALLHGGPEPTDIVFSTRVAPVGTAPEDKAVADNKLGTAAKAPFQRYRVEFALPSDQLQLAQTPDGNRHVTLEFAVAVYKQDGTLVASVDKSTQANISSAAYAQLQQKGIPYTEDISVPAKGTYFLRMAVRQVETDRAGAVEIPVAAVSKLQPLDVSSAVPPAAPTR